MTSGDHSEVDPPPGEFGKSQSLELALDRLLRVIWPRRSHAELLLDLGEGKRWTEADRRAQTTACATWLAREGVVEAPLVPKAAPAKASPSRAMIEASLARYLPRSLWTRAPGTSALISQLAPALGSHPKTLANSLRKGIRPSRRDHRWMVTIYGLLVGNPRLDAWIFHRRTPASIAAALSDTPLPGVSDALLVLSLVALWQRRRPTAAVRGNRGQPQARRVTPKPAAALEWQLISPGQVPHLITMASKLGEAGCAVGTLAIECALTEAHLAPHPSRGVAANQGSLVDSGEALLIAAERGLHDLHDRDLVPPADAEVFEYRISRMRAWRDRGPPAQPSAAASASAYVVACLALDDLRAGKITEFPPIHASTPGLAMLLPQLRAAGAPVIP